MENEFVLRRIPNRVRKLTVRSTNAFDTLGPVEREENLGIPVRLKCIAAGLQRFPQILIVEDLAVETDRLVASLHGLPRA